LGDNDGGACVADWVESRDPEPRDLICHNHYSGLHASFFNILNTDLEVVPAGIGVYPVFKALWKNQIYNLFIFILNFVIISLLIRSHQVVLVIVSRVLSQFRVVAHLVQKPNRIFVFEVFDSRR